MKNLLILFLTPASLLAEINLKVALYPYIPEGAEAAERFEEAFEAYCLKKHHLDVDLDFELVDTYGSPQSALDYDVAEIDLCVIEALEREGEFPLADISGMIKADLTEVGGATSISEKPWARKVVPHWLCGQFLICRETDKKLAQAASFEGVVDALDPAAQRFLFADLWGSGTLGEIYADAVLDLYGLEEAKLHLSELAALWAVNATDQEEESAVAKAKLKLRAEAVLAIWRLTQELRPEHRRNKVEIHDSEMTYIYPQAFEESSGSALLGYSERMFFVETEIRDKPWDGDAWPIPASEILVRQFPFGLESKGTPTWCDAFVVPEEKLTDEKRPAIEAFLQFAVSEEGYRLLQISNSWIESPYKYLLPAYQEIVDAAVIQKHMPLLPEFVAALDSSFPVFDYEVYRGMKLAGKALEGILKNP